MSSNICGEVCCEMYIFCNCLKRIEIQVALKLPYKVDVFCFVILWPWSLHGLSIELTSFSFSEFGCLYDTNVTLFVTGFSGRKPRLIPALIFCSVCDKSFTRRKNWKRHYREKHDDSNQFYFCNICKQTFKRKYHLVRHMETKNCGVVQTNR